LNGVLFIDEAYSIVGDKDDSCGKEAVSTLIKRMEDDRKNLIVILAGYTDQMNTFIETNPGFKSRFNRYIDFSDYTPEELLAIYESMSLKLDFVLTDKAKLKLVQVLSNAYSNRDETFGNGRYVRNLFEKSMELQANRIAVIGKLTIDLLRTIEEIDIPD
jgi:ATP-dependent Clp protease ATP-binding subunit ClpA